MKIIKLVAENVKKIRAVEITPHSAMVQVTGPNASGKSSVLDAIFYALCGTAGIPSHVVRDGEEKAFVRLDLGEVVVTRRFTAAGGTSLTVEAASGARFPSPQTMLDGLLGQLSFDPLAFARAKPAAQLEQLKRLVPLSVDLNVLEAQNAADFSRRTDVNRKIKELEARIAGEQSKLEGAPIPAKAPDFGSLMDELNTANAHNLAKQRERDEVKTRRHEGRLRFEKLVSGVNADVDRHRKLIESQVDVAKQCLSEAEELEKKATNLRAQAAQLTLDNEKRAKEVEELKGTLQRLEAGQKTADDAFAAHLDVPLDLIDTSEIQQRISSCREDARLYEIGENIKELKASLAARSREAGDLSRQIAQRDADKRRAIAEAKMPVDGLEFAPAGVLYKGRPLENASESEKLRVSVAIAMAANPQLRVIRVKEGSLLDDAGLKLLSDLAESGDYQVWVERVDTSGKVGVVMEDGTAKEATDGQVDESAG